MLTDLSIPNPSTDMLIIYMLIYLSYLLTCCRFLEAIEEGREDQVIGTIRCHRSLIHNISILYYMHTIYIRSVYVHMLTSCILNI